MKKLKNYIMLFIAMILIFSLGMIFSSLLPNGRIRSHIEESKDILMKSNNNPLFDNYIIGGKVDDYTDLIIMNIAANKGTSENESPLIKAFENSIYNNEEGNQYKSLEETISNESLYNNASYARYWHGIQTIVRPLLLVFNYEEIRYLFMIIMFLLLSITTVGIYENLTIFHALSFAFSMLAVCFFIIPASLQYIGVFAIMMCAIIIINILYKKQKLGLLPYVFFVLGGLTTFFDLLTVPMITLGMPLIIVILLKGQQKENIKELILEIIKLSILWCVSYATIFFAKWIIASLILHKNIIKEAINQIIFRTNGSEEYPTTRLGAIAENFRFLCNNVMVVSTVGIAIAWVIALIKHRKRFNEIKGVIPLVIIAIFPYVWYFVFAGHSIIHAFFTYRLQAIFIFAVLCAMIECIDIKKYVKGK